MASSSHQDTQFSLQVHVSWYGMQGPKVHMAPACPQIPMTKKEKEKEKENKKAWLLFRDSTCDLTANLPFFHASWRRYWFMSIQEMFFPICLKTLLCSIPGDTPFCL